jgi:Domain of unknown function (DUF4226)
MASYEELRDALRHINDLYRDPNAWRRGLSAQEVADITGYLNADTKRELLARSWRDAAIYGWVDPATHRAYQYLPTSTGENPQVPDTLIGSLRNHNPALFGPGGQPVTPPPPAPPPAAVPLPTDPELATNEQQSGRTADAVAKLQGELKNRYTQLNSAEEQLSEVLLNAHATSTDGQRKLNGIQSKIVAAVNNPSSALDTPAGETQFLKFLRTQIGAIAEVLNSGTLTAADQATAAKALADLYAADGAAPHDAPRVAGDLAPPAPAPADAGVDEPVPDPSLADLGPLADPVPVAPDPLSALASTLPASLGAFPPGLGGGLDGLAGLPMTAAPVAGLASGLDNPPRRDDADNGQDSKDGGGKESTPDDTGSVNDKGTKHDPAGTHDPQPAPPPAQPSATGPDPSPTAVRLPDGSTADAATPAAAQAVRACLAGTPLDVAYRQAGVPLPPPGTPVTAPIDPSQLVAGDVGMFKDHYVVALGTAKALKDGQVVPLASISSSPDFLGWLRPSASEPAHQPPAPATAPG